MNPTAEPILAAGFPLGSSAGLVTAFEWLGQPYRITRVDMLGEMRADAYKRLNGRVETPVLITEKGRVVTEGRVDFGIVRRIITVIGMRFENRI